MIEHHFPVIVQRPDTATREVYDVSGRRSVTRHAADAVVARLCQKRLPVGSAITIGHLQRLEDGRSQYAPIARLVRVRRQPAYPDGWKKEA
jgi:hypothetical protein